MLIELLINFNYDQIILVRYGRLDRGCFQIIDRPHLA